jgi:transposase
MSASISLPMTRIARYVVPGLPHHVMQRGNRRERVFFGDNDYRLYRDLLREAFTAILPPRFVGFPDHGGQHSGSRGSRAAPLAFRRKRPWAKMSLVDGGYQGDKAQRAAFEASRIAVTVVKHAYKQLKGFVALPNRWAVERSLGWINRARHLSKDFEATIESALAWVLLALAFLIMRRLARSKSAAA